MATKRKASAMAAVEDDEPVDPSDEFSFLGLGGCQEVGRSCHIIQYKGKIVMVWDSLLQCMRSYNDL
jgi:cleavage and polyadenylation specificity factor subunit 3